MRPINALLPAALLSFAMIACQQADPNNIAIDDSNNAAMEVEALPPSEESSGPINGVNESDDAGSEAALIPVQYHGRWGMVPADCTSTRGDAKGLITIANMTIKFYESTATLRDQRPAIATSFSGLYDFTGEGQTWQKAVTLTRTGDTLKRADEEGNYSYTRCKA
ncbi:MAG: hypothetical protein ABIP07_03290 [Sphingomicrobium sp.]